MLSLDKQAELNPIKLINMGNNFIRQINVCHDHQFSSVPFSHILYFVLSALITNIKNTCTNAHHTSQVAVFTKAAHCHLLFPGYCVLILSKTKLCGIMNECFIIALYIILTVTSGISTHLKQ
jgi:hypothetical protein